jgi:hypothetical protein
MGQRPGHGRQKPPKRSSYAGRITCLRCEAIFESWDRRQNRLCPSCRETIAAQPSDEPAHRLPKRKGHPRPGDDG